jgi:hypothetical protein
MAVEFIELKMRISKHCTVTLQLTGGVVTREGIEKLMEVLKLVQDTYPLDSELTQETVNADSATAGGV